MSGQQVCFSHSTYSYTPEKCLLEMFHPGKQTMSSGRESSGASDGGPLNEVDSRGNQSCATQGEVPKRPKRSTVPSSGEDPGKSLTTKRRPVDQDDKVYCNTKEDVRMVKNKVSKTLSFPKVETQSKYSKEGTASEEYVPDDVEYISSEQDEGQTRSQPSQRSTDCSKSFSQIYSEIFEESRERQQKAEQACRTYNINRSKLQGRSQSRGRESVTYSSLGSDYSSDLRRRSEEYDNPSMDEFDSIYEQQSKHIAGYRNTTSNNTIRSSFKRLPVSKNEAVQLRESLKGSECSGRKLESKKSDLNKYYDKESYGESSTNGYRLRPCLSHRESSVFSKTCAYSRPTKYQRESCYTGQTNDRDYLTDCTGTSPRRSQRDYHPRSSTRQSHHYYRRLESVPKTYQDRGNSPINIKTRRQTNESQNLCIDMDTEKERDSSFRRSSVSVGVQYPSDDEEQNSTEELNSSILDIKQARADEIQSIKPTRKSYYKENVLSFTQLVRSVYDDDLEMTSTAENMIFSGVASEEEVPQEPSQYVFEEPRNPAGFNTEEEFTDEYSRGITYDTKSNSTYEYDPNENRSEITNELDQIDDEAVEKLGDEEDEGVLSNQPSVNKMTDDESRLTTESLEKMRQNTLGLRIYNADEALMEIPEGFKGSAIILDDDADFLDITLTDDEEHIRAKLMAAALTTKTNNPSSNATTSRKSRRSTDSTSSVLSYKPSVIFTRRSEVTEDEAPPQPTDRISLLAERVLRACANPYTETANWEPLATPKAQFKPLEQSDFTKLTTSIVNDCKNPFDGALQLLSMEFNRKLQRQIKEIAESFR